ncbi:hypothetical protein KZ810_08040 [Sphingomonas sp. RHCKR47]|uniref:hypothetical protein n=1 Tax=Sphingomonas citricola TaxID=2862498 RepID=UPI001CA47B95|nr:hypothetical protein [Sphingomonas citricola]MBW6523447.1 hypothetical protein [Sphingomonas citricola]
MAFQQSDLDKLDAAILDDTLEVQFADGRKVRKHSKADMLALRVEVKADLASAASQTRPLRRTTIGRFRRS